MTLSIWDTCGNEMDLKILPSNIYKISSAYIIVCSYDNRDSLDNLQIWIKHVQLYFNSRAFPSNNIYNIPIVILINKSDIKKDRKFKISDVIKTTDEFDLNILIYEVSAKENTKLDYVFEKIVGLISGSISKANEVSFQSNSTIDNTGVNKIRQKSFTLKKTIHDRDPNAGSCCAK